MTFKKKLGWLLGALSTLSGILSLPGKLESVATWLSAVAGISISLDIHPILFVGLALFPVYLVANAVLYFRRKAMKKVIIFEAEILEKKRFELGETVFTKVRFRGQLKNGFFDNQICAPESKLLPDGRDHTWFWDPKTLANSYPNTQGNLQGNVDFESTWGWTIPSNYPTGEYTIFIRVYDHLGVGNRPVIKEKKETITIVPTGKVTISRPAVDERKRAFKLAIRRELVELVDSISTSKGYKLFLPQDWPAHAPSERRLLLDTDREWELLTDFYGKLKSRNDYASSYQPYDPAISKSKTMEELDRQCVEAGQRALRDIEWGS